MVSGLNFLLLCIFKCKVIIKIPNRSCRCRLLCSNLFFGGTTVKQVQRHVHSYQSWTCGSRRSLIQRPPVFIFLSPAPDLFLSLWSFVKTETVADAVSVWTQSFQSLAKPSYLQSHLRRLFLNISHSHVCFLCIEEKEPTFKVCRVFRFLFFSSLSLSWSHRARTELWKQMWHYRRIL